MLAVNRLIERKAVNISWLVMIAENFASRFLYTRLIPHTHGTRCPYSLVLIGTEEWGYIGK
jgi:hypothetical protein